MAATELILDQGIEDVLRECPSKLQDWIRTHGGIQCACGIWTLPEAAWQHRGEPPICSICADAKGEFRSADVPALIVDPRWPHDLLDHRSPCFLIDLKTYIYQGGFGDGGASPEHLVLKFGERPPFEHVPLLVPATVPGIVVAHLTGLEWDRVPVSNAPFSIGLGFVAKYRDRVLHLKKFRPLPAGDVHWLLQAVAGQASKALHWTPPADAKPGDPLYAPPADLSPEEQIIWCKQNWQPVWEKRRDPNIDIHYDPCAFKRMWPRTEQDHFTKFEHRFDDAQGCAHQAKIHSPRDMNTRAPIVDDYATLLGLLEDGNIRLFAVETLYGDNKPVTNFLPNSTDAQRRRMAEILNRLRPYISQHTQIEFTDKPLTDSEKAQVIEFVRHDEKVRHEIADFDAIDESQTLHDKDTTSRRRRAMEKEMSHICPSDICPSNCCQLDGADSNFTHAFYAADNETRLQVCKGGFFAVVLRDQYRIYYLGALGTPLDQIDDVYDKLSDDSKKEAVRAAHKKAKRQKLGVHATQQLEDETAARADRAFEDGIITEVEPPVDPNIVCPVCGKPLTGFFTMNTHPDNSASSA